MMLTRSQQVVRPSAWSSTFWTENWRAAVTLALGYFYTIFGFAAFL